MINDHPLTIKEAAEFFKCTPRTVRKMTGNGLGYYRVGGQLRFSYQEHILPFLKSKEVRSGAAQ